MFTFRDWLTSCNLHNLENNIFLFISRTRIYFKMSDGKH